MRGQNPKRDLSTSHANIHWDVWELGNSLAHHINKERKPSTSKGVLRNTWDDRTREITLVISLYNSVILDY